MNSSDVLPERPNYRRAVSAVLLTLLNPGLGLYYAGARRTGLIVMITIFAFTTLARLITRIHAPTAALILVFAISLVVLFIAVICFAFNAAHRAAKTKPALDTRWWQSTFTIFVVSLAINLVAEVTMPFRWRTFSVPSGSDLPTILPGESFVADVRPETQNLLRGRMIVFHPPGSRLSYVKRVVGVQGDRIQIQNGQLYINGRAVERQDLPLWQWNNGTGEAVSLHHYRETIPGAPPYEIVKYSDDARIDIGTGIDANNTPEFTVPENALFVLGDNRDNSLDSRFPAVGYVPVSNVVGVAGVIYWSGVNARIGTSIN